MIFSTDKNLFPTGDGSMELNYYEDLNGFKWGISRVENGFFIKYFGDPYFMDKHLNLHEIETLINNTGCYFIQDDSFETFLDFRQMIQEEYTDDIFEEIADYMTIRIIALKSIMEIERIK